MSRIVLIASGKGGVGKSSLAAALAVSLAGRGLRTLLLDADIGLRSLDLMLGMQDQVLYELSDCLAGRCSLQQTLIAHPQHPLLHLMIGGQQARPGDFEVKDLTKALNTLSKRYDIILIDGPAGLGRGLRNFLGMADRYVLVATPDSVCLRDTEKTAQFMMDRGAQRPDLLINRYDLLLAKRQLLSKPEDLALALDLALVGTIPDSEEACQLTQQGKTLAEAKDAYVRAAIGLSCDGLLGIAQPPVGLPQPTWRDKLRLFLKD